MQGHDKGLLTAQGKMLIEYTIATLNRQVDHMVISANRNLDEYKRFKYPVFSDTQADYAGPLAGILTALDNIHEEALLLVTPCDMPMLPDDLAQRLSEQLLRQEAQICCARTKERLQPLVAIMHTGVRSNLEAYMKSGERKVQGWLQQLAFTTVDYSSQETAFININTQVELSQYEQQQNND